MNSLAQAIARLLSSGGALVVIVTALAGCATVTEEDIRRSNEGTMVIQTEMSYERAYRIIASQSRRCFERSFSGSSVIVRADLYADSRAGEISVSGSSFGGNVADIVFDVRATGQNTSEVKIYYRKKNVETAGRAAAKWLQGDTTVCNA